MDRPHRKRCQRYDVPGEAHCLTFSCFHRLPLLDRVRSRNWMLDAIACGRTKSLFDLWAYVIMPEHVHLVLLPKNDARIADILTAIKQPVAKKAILWLRRHAPEFLKRVEDVQPNGKRHYRFWQRGGGYDRNLRSVRDIHEKIRYVHENPVRRGLVDCPENFPWSSASAWATGTNEPLSIDRESVPPLTILDDAPASSLMQN